MENKSAINTTSFNQDYSCFSVGTELGFIIYTTDPLKERFRRENLGSLKIVEMLFRTNILALVGTKSNPKFPPNKVMIWDDIRSEVVTELDYSSEVKGVRLRKDKIFIVLETQVWIHNFQDINMKPIDIKTYINPKGLCVVHPTEPIVVCLGETIGSVAIYNDFENEKSPVVINAHDSDIFQTCMSQDGKLIATCSSKGTIIRLWRTSDGTQVNEFRRGTSRAIINYLAFNKAGTLLCASSDHGTIHVFSCDGAAEGNRTSTFSFLSPVVPVFGSSWSWKQFSVQEEHAICSFSEDKGVIVLGTTGGYYKYSMQDNSIKMSEIKIGS